jgi:hypothetical protein
MAEVLSYRSAPKRPPPKDPKWTAKRVAYYFALLGWFCLIAFWAGPNVWLFGRVTGMRESDLHENVKQRFVPAIRAVLEYQRDFGALPDNSWNAKVVYFGKYTQVGWGGEHIRNGVLSDYGRYNQCISYDFSHPEAPWTTWGAFYNGPINLPPVTLDTPFEPTTRPTKTN